MARNVNSPLRNSPYKLRCIEKARRQSGGSRCLYLFKFQRHQAFALRENVLNVSPLLSAAYICYAHLLKITRLSICSKFKVIINNQKKKKQQFHDTSSPSPVYLPTFPNIRNVRLWRLQKFDGRGTIRYDEA